MEIKVGEHYNVVASKILQYGVVVLMDDETTQLIHISKLADAFVNNVEDYVVIGKTYEAVGVKGKQKPVELSIRESDIHPSSDRFRPKQHKVDYSPRKKDFSEPSYSDIPDRRSKSKGKSRNSRRSRTKYDWR